MRAAPPVLHVELHRSRALSAFVLAGYGATAALLAALPLPWLARIAGALVVLTMAAMEISSRSGERAPKALAVDDRGNLCVTLRDGTQCRGAVAADTCVAGRITTIVWRPSGARIARTLLLLPDGIDADAFRRLRVRLRHLRVAVQVPGSNDDDAG